MAVTGNEKTSWELDKEAAKDTVSTFIRLQLRDEYRRRMNLVWPEVNRQIDELTALGAKVDIPLLIRQIVIEKGLGLPGGSQ